MCLTLKKFKKKWTKTHLNDRMPSAIKVTGDKHIVLEIQISRSYARLLVLTSYEHSNSELLCKLRMF